MAEEYTGKDQPTDGEGAKFRGVLTDVGGGDLVFLSPAGDAPTGIVGERVAAQRVNQPSTIGMGLAVGTKEDSAASDDTGTWTQMSLLKRLLVRFSTLISNVATGVTNTTDILAALGAPNSTKVVTDVDASINSRMRGLIELIDAVKTVLGATSGAKVITDAAGTVQQYLRGLVHYSEYLRQYLGETGDLAIAPDQNGPLSGRVRALLKTLGATDDAAVSTNANGTISAKLRGGIVLLLDLLARIGATSDAAVLNSADGSVFARLRGLHTALGNAGDAAWVSGSGAVIPLLKGLAASLTTLIARLPGALSAPTHGAPAVATTTTPVFTTNSSAVYRLVVNNTDATIWLTEGAAAVVGQGIPLRPYGGAYEMSIRLGNLYQGAINGIQDAGGTKTITTTEA